MKIERRRFLGAAKSLSVLAVVPLVGCNTVEVEYANRYERLRNGDARARQVDTSELRGLSGKAAFWAGLLFDPGASDLQDGANIALATELYRRALGSGVAVAGHNLALLAMERNVALLPQMGERKAERIQSLLTDASDAGCVSSMVLLGHLYRDGAAGLERNLVLAADSFERAAKWRKDPLAEWELGRMYLRAQGRQRDVRLGVQLLTSAASAGIADAAVELADQASSSALRARWYGVAASIAPATYSSRYSAARKRLSVDEIIDVEAALAVWRDAYVGRASKIVDPTKPWTSV